LKTTGNNLARGFLLFRGVVIGREVVDLVRPRLGKQIVHARQVADVESRETDKALGPVTAGTIQAEDCGALLVQEGTQ
jgi:hypothetical protein